MNIIWKKTNEELAISFLSEEVIAKEHAVFLKEQNILPSTWEAVAFDIVVPNHWGNQEDFRFDGNVVYVDINALRARLLLFFKNDEINLQKISKAKTIDDMEGIFNNAN
jgi:hypothetical protein